MMNSDSSLKSKRLKAVRILMYLDVLLVVLSLCRLDHRNLAFADNSASYIRIVILVALFIILYVKEKNISRYLRENGDE